MMSRLQYQRFIIPLFKEIIQDSNSDSQPLEGSSFSVLEVENEGAASLQKGVSPYTLIIKRPYIKNLPCGGRPRIDGCPSGVVA